MDRLMTKTLAEIYLQQGHLEEAYEIFKALSEKNPADADLQRRLRELDERLNPARFQTTPQPPFNEEKIRILEQWLANIEKRRRRG